MKVSSPAIWVATGVALAGSPSVSKRSRVTSHSSLSHWLIASSAPSTDGMTMLALAPERAPIAPILKLQSSPPASLPPPSSVCAARSQREAGHSRERDGLPRLG